MEAIAKGASASRALAGVFGDVSWKANWRRELRSSPGGSSSSSTTSGTTTTLSTPNSNTPWCLSPLPTDGCFDPILDLSWWVCEDREKKLDFVKRLFDEFCVANGDASVLELWLPEMAAVSRRHVTAGDATTLLQFAGSWIRALTDIAESIRNAYLAAMFSVPEGGPAHVQLARFTRAFILKMSPFVDALVAPYFCSSTDGGESETIVVADGAPSPTAAEKLQPLLGIREAVSRASQDIRLSFCSTSSVEAKRITDEIASLLLSKEGELDEAIWSIIQEVRARLLPSTELEVDDGPWWGTQILRGSSPEVHQVTGAVVSYISLLSANCTTVHRIVGQFAARFREYVPTMDSMSPLNSLIMETVSSLHEKLAEKSRSFRDQSLRFLFLINNSYFIWQHLYPISVPEVNKFLEGKIDNYVETYLHVSWEPVLSCLCIRLDEKLEAR
jgi:hypothetical protein